MIKDLVRSFLVNTLTLFVITQYILGFQLNNGVIPLFIISLAFTILHLVMKPLLETIFSSINFLTLGAVGVAVDSAILFLITKYFDEVSISQWHFSGFQVQNFTVPSAEISSLATVIIVALILNFVRTVVEVLT